ncbi:MAG: EsaB/YukD family protein [bacterium]
METIIVEIFVPATSSSFDFRLPAAGKVSDVTSEIMRILESTQQNLAFDSEYPMLCDLDAGCILDPAQTVAECGLHDSARLLLV